jgi:uncharacterized protein YndB with AHSA1/START domain
VTAETVVVHLQIDAPPEVVFDCFCDPKALITWMGEAAATEPWPGGHFAVDIDDMQVRGEFKIVERPTRLVFSWGFAGIPHLPPGASTVEVTFAAHGNGTALTLVHRGLPEDELPKHVKGWNQFLPELATVAPRPSTRFRALGYTFASDPHVSTPDFDASSGRKFGSNGLKFKGKIFAMLARDQLVVKLPEQRVSALIATGDGQRMISSGGREMKEWLVVDARSRQDWILLAHEACEFAKGGAA